MNPEFQRQLILEFSGTRLLAMPAFLAVIFSLTYLLDDRIFSGATANTAIGLYIAIVLFWGSKQASESIADELRNNTWDIQKTSALSAWALCWGKLFGSTLYNWYGGILCLLMFSFTTNDSELLQLTWLYALACGLFVQSLSLLISLFSLRRKQAINSGANYMFALFSLFYIMPIMLNIDELSNHSVNWYGHHYNQAYFNLIALLMSCGWVITGIYRLLADELRIRSLPIVWCVFIAFLTLYISGFIDAYDLVNKSLPVIITMVGFAVCIVLSYVLMFVDINSPMQFRKIAIYFQQQQWTRLLQEVPCWFVNIILALPMMLILTLLFPVESVENITLYPIVIFLLLLRDIAILLFFSYAPNPKRALSITVLFLICLYGLLPAIFLNSGADIIALMFLPLLTLNTVLAIVIAGMQTTLIGFLLYHRWQNRVDLVETI